jgi:hypothetical protein
MSAATAQLRMGAGSGFGHGTKWADRIQFHLENLHLPMGSAQDGGIGSMELKAAWMEVTDPQNTKWDRCKLTSAIVPDPSTQKCRTATVALVGLHITHKTSSEPTWVWATFEHVDNAPNNNQDAGTTDWNFHDPSCTSKPITNVPARCTLDGGSSVTVTCTPNTVPPYYLGEGCPPPAPIQVTRLTPIDALATSTNQLVQQAIAQNYPDSVWRNYQC